MQLESEGTAFAQSGSGRWSQLKSLFYRALEMPEGERSAWLRDACAEDVSLCEDVQHLLADHAAAHSFLQGSGEDAAVGPRFAEGEVLADRFRIRRLIGLGGMGEVYEADDLCVGELCALKTIRPEIAADDRLARRLRSELQLSRHIAHPNVCRVNELWEISVPGNGSIAFFTMELLTGQTLADRIKSAGRLNPAEAMPIIRQVAAGLAEAHRLGIVHRDLKPGNIFLTSEGRVVVMDFGLARSLEPGFGFQSHTGLALGTPAYMAPEQFAGGKATPATDIYALGVTIFEMVTGRAHPLISPLSLVADLDPVWEKTVLRCLEVDASHRPATPGEVAALLETAVKRPGSRKKILAATLIAVALAGAAALGLRFSATPRIPLEASTTKLTFDQGFTTDPAISRDGKVLVYSADRGQRGDLNIWLQRLDKDETRQLTDDPGHETEPAISPDERQIAYRSEREETIYVQPIAGGPAQAVARWGHNPRFSPDGKQIVYWTGQGTEHATNSGRIWLVPASGGAAPQPLAADFADARHPEWSVDGRRILFRGAKTAYPTLDDNLDFWTIDSQGNSPSRLGAWGSFRVAGLTPQDSSFFWDGKQIVFPARAGHSTNLWSLPFSEASRRVATNPERLTTGAELEVSPTFASSGRIIYANWRSRFNVWRFSLRYRKLEQVTSGDSIDSKVSVSRNSKTVVYGRRLGEARDIWLKDLVSGTDRQILSNESAVPFVSPDGKSVTYSIGDSIYLIDVSGGGQVEVCRSCGELLGWQPNGAGLLYLSTTPSSGKRIELLDLKRRTRRVLVSGLELREAALSPDGKALAFTARQGGVLSGIYLVRFEPAVQADTGLLVTRSDSWADKPAWSNSGKTLFYASDRDGFKCIWRQEIDTAQLRIIGSAKPVQHFHTARFSPFMVSRQAFSLAASADYLYFNLADIEGNIWALEPRVTRK